MVRIIGDVHNKIHEYMTLIRGIEQSIQIGDMGIGFSTSIEFMAPSGHVFFRGNHDNPAVCQLHPNYLSDYGYDSVNKIYWIAGADSIDKGMRTEGKSWWKDEELNMDILNFIVGDVIEKKPNIILSHDCPQTIAYKTHNIPDSTRTRQALDSILYFFKPKLWIYGHHHCGIVTDYEGTQFRCLNELEYIDVIT